MVIDDTYILQLNTYQISLIVFKFGTFLDQRLCILSRQRITYIKVVIYLNFYPIELILNFWYVFYEKHLNLTEII
jgi:hypothetical protein